MLPTPDTDHIGSNTYTPAEDSYLFLDALSAPNETAYLSRRFTSSKEGPPPLAVEIGTGSGIILAFLTANAQAIIGRADLLTLGTDINPSACIAAEQTVRCHCIEKTRTTGVTTGVHLGCVNDDLTSSLRPGAVDILLFNPPYVPSDSLPLLDNVPAKSGLETDSTFLAFATDGGVDGMEVTERVLQGLHIILSRRGVAYILLCKRNKPDGVIRRVRSWAGGWAADVVKDSGKTGGIEHLCILRLARVMEG